MLVDYGEVLGRLEAALGRHWRDNPSLLNVPGLSVAMKIDPFYYLALRPSFCTLLGKWAGVTPTRVEETLTRTGNLSLGPDRARYGEPLAVFEEGGTAVVRLAADLVPAGFCDRALALYGGATAPLPVSRLRLVADQRPALDAFLAGKTVLSALAFGRPGRA